MERTVRLYYIGPGFVFSSIDPDGLPAYFSSTAPLENAPADYPPLFLKGKTVYEALLELNRKLTLFYPDSVVVIIVPDI